MFLLHKLQEGRHVRPAEVVDGFEAGEHAPPLQSLEMILANVLEKKEREISVSKHCYGPAAIALPTWWYAGRTYGRTV